MNNFYAVCHLGEEVGRVMLGMLQKDKLVVSEVRRFHNSPLEEKGARQWNIPHVYRELLAGLKEIGSHDEPVSSVTCTSSAADYMLFDSSGALMTPTYHHSDPRSEAGMKEVLSKVAWETIYGETGVYKTPDTTLCQLGDEKIRRLKRSTHLMPVADGFNFLLSGVPRVELSLASLTQLCNPVSRSWSEPLINALGFPANIFPDLVPAGSKLGLMRPDIGKETNLEDTKVVASCSHDIAAALVGLPIEEEGTWAFLRSGDSAVMGTEVAGPVINEASREWKFTNGTGYGGATAFYKHAFGLRILEECRQFWKDKERDLDNDVLMHLTISAPPFESLVNLSDPRFLTAGSMPAKIQEYCRETDQPVPRKPGPLARCVLESLALQYRQILREMQYLTGREFTKIYLFGTPMNSLLNHFTANALQMPVVVVPFDTVGIGNILVQALALNHIKLFDQARDLVRNGFKTEMIVPHATAWDDAADRLAQLAAAGA